MKKRNQRDKSSNNSSIEDCSVLISKNKEFSKCFKENPNISHFNLDSFFIYDQQDLIDYFDNLTQKSSVKLNKEEISFIHDKIDEIELIESYNHSESFIFIKEKFLDNLNNLKLYKKPESEVEIFVKNKIKNCANRAEITCKKLSNLFFEFSGKSVSKSTINNIIRNRLGYKFLKTTYKNNFLKSKNGTILCLCFIKLFTRILKLGFKVIFLDESKIELNNTHLKCWRKTNEVIYYSSGKKNKLNLIMAISQDNVYQITMGNETTNSKSFIKFMDLLYSEFQKEPKKRFVIILDNLKVHKTKEVISFCKERKINLLFNVPYQSVFNSIELCFRALKKMIYSKIYETTEEIKLDIENIIKTEKFRNTLYYNYKETLKEFLYYEQNHKYDNLN